METTISPLQGFYITIVKSKENPSAFYVYLFVQRFSETGMYQAGRIEIFLFQKDAFTTPSFIYFR